MHRTTVGNKRAIVSLSAQPSVGGVTVSIVAFQAVDPGSTPGQRINFCLFFPFPMGGAHIQIRHNYDILGEVPNFISYFRSPPYKVWNADTGSLIFTLNMTNSGVSSIAINSNG